MLEVLPYCLMINCRKSLCLDCCSIGALVERDLEGLSMAVNIDGFSVSNSRPFDVHRWSEHCEVDLFVNKLWDSFYLQQPSVASHKGRPSKVIKRDGMKVLLLDLYVCWCEDKTKYIGISSNVNNWSRGRYRALHLSKSILDILRWLVEEGYVEKRDYYHDSVDPSQSRTARYRASPKLQTLFKAAMFGLDDLCSHDEKETIILKDDVTDDTKADSKSSIEYEDTPTIIAMREQLKAYNQLLKRTHVDICSLTVPVVRRKIKNGKLREGYSTVAIGQHSKHVYRIFSRGSWELHGRFNGGWWQQIDSELRSQIFINGNPTVEVDFKAMHVSMLNAQTGSAVVYDPYAVGGRVFPDVDRDTVRSWNKRLVLAAINAKSRKGAYGAFRKSAETGSFEKGLKDRELARLLDAFIANNPHLTDFIGSDQGIKLMNKDSQIAAKIIATLTDKNIPVLTIHDSFIVQRHHFAELRIAMAMASLKYCKRDLIAEQDELIVRFEEEMSWAVINEQAVNKLPKHEICQHYLDRFNRFCDAKGFVPKKTSKGRGLMARSVFMLS